MNDWVIIGIFATILVLFIIILVIVLMQSRHKQEVIIREMALRSQKQTSEELLELREKVTRELMQFEFQMSETMKDHLSLMENRMHEGIHKNFSITSDSFTQMMQQMTSIQKTQESLDGLAGSLSSLQTILADKKSRGIFGEVQLYSLLESVYGVNDQLFQKQYKLRNGSIVDAMLFGPNGIGMIGVDSKFPLENYNRMFEDVGPNEKAQAQKAFKQDVIKHIKDIHIKYVNTDETGDFAYMFVPAEAVFAYIYGQLDDVVQLSYQHRVFIVSPTTLMAYITAMQAIGLGQKRNEKVEWMQKEFGKLAIEFERFSSRFETLMKDYDKLYKDMHSVSITSDKILHKFERISNADESVMDENS